MKKKTYCYAIINRNTGMLLSVFSSAKKANEKLASFGKPENWHIQKHIIY